MDHTPAGTDRRPLKSRSSGWAQAAVRLLARTAITPNQVSLASVLFAATGAAVLLVFPRPWALLVCALCVQLRLACNLFDGMLAVEAKKGTSPVGGVYNELPDRIADALFIVSLGYAVSSAWLGWAGALLAVLTAYIRALGASLGAPQDFRGPMAKPHRMATLTVACLIGAVESFVTHTHYTLLAAAWVIMLGSFLTCIARARALARALRAKAASA
jgi:phosphatidylglycerophosphate synthase